MTLAFIQNMGPWQLLVCLIVIALLFGGKKIPDIARSLGKAKGEFKKGLAEGEKPDEEEAKIPAPEAPKQVEKTA
jgi:sec-independent protein translocase protein TatA